MRPVQTTKMRWNQTALVATALLAFASPIRAVEFSGRVELEVRGFPQSPSHRRQSHDGLSLAVLPEFYRAFDDDRQSVLFMPFVRLDSADDRRSHFDIRELMYQRVFESVELRAGIGRVFWGVSESYHLVDIINQTDLVENIDREGKLGQPLVNLTFIRDWGDLDLFVLPGFRERTFPGPKGRLRSELYVDTDRSTYESGAGPPPYRLRGAVVARDRGLRHRGRALPRNEPGAATSARVRRRAPGDHHSLRPRYGGPCAPLRCCPSHVARSAGDQGCDALEARSTPRIGSRR